MSIAAKLRRAPLRAVTGAFILNTGLGKLKGDAQTAAGIHGMAVGAYPVVSKLSPTVFLKVLAVSEIADRLDSAVSGRTRRTGRHRADRIRRQPARHLRPDPGIARQQAAPDPGRNCLSPKTSGWRVLASR